MLGSIFLGFSFICAYPDIWAKPFTAPPQSSGAFLAITGACAFDGLIICLNLVKHGLNYDKLKKLEQRSRKGKF